MSLSNLKKFLKQYVITGLLVIALIISSVMSMGRPSTLLRSLQNSSLQSLTSNRKGYEVFGFAPYWTFDKLQNVDFSVLTTFAYFDIPVTSDGNLDTTDVGYQTFESQQATDIFQRAHSHGTRVVVTLTQMDNNTILAFLDSSSAQQTMIDQAVSTVKSRGIDGVNVDFEYLGDPGQDYRNKFSQFIQNLTTAMHKQIKNSNVTVSVYASAVKDPKIYDIASLGKITDGIFMMAYDFATVGADNAMPTAPLHGAKDGTYWYDVATAVEDFLHLMPANKLILGVPWYAYNYVVTSPGVNATTLPYYSWKGQPITQTYSVATTQITPASSDITNYQTGWDSKGDVGWKAYYVPATGAWRIIFIDDVKSLSMKYDFAKEKSLKGVGMWALGFDDGTHEMWSLLSDKFGTKVADNSVISKQISQIN